MWRLTILSFAILASAAARVEVHFYDSGECGATVPSDQNYFFDEGTCYLNRDFGSVVGCTAQRTCLAQQLEFDAFENCVAPGNLTSSGSFDVVATATEKIRRNYLSVDCSGTFTEVELADNCDLEECGFVRSQVFPQNLDIEVIDSDDDDSDVSTGEIIGAVIGPVAVVVLICCSLACVWLCCMFCVLAIVVVIALIVAVVLAKTAKSAKPKSEDEEGGKLPKSSPIDRVKEAGLNLSSAALEKVPRGRKE